MQEKYEQAIKETFEYLNKCLEEQPKKDTFEYLYSLGIDKCFVIENIMAKKGFEVRAEYYAHKLEAIAVYPKVDNLPIHIWRNKYVY
jgi:hypothetical protein